MSKYDGDRFYGRLASLHADWLEHRSAYWKGCDGFVVLSGQPSEEDNKKSTTLSVWLFGMEISSILFVVCQEKIVLVSTSAKVKAFQGMTKPSSLSFDVDFMSFSPDKAEETFQKVGKMLKGSFKGKAVGVLQREMKNEAGKLADAWNKYYVSFLKKEELSAVSIIEGLGGVWSVKKDNELEVLKKSAAITTSAYNKFLLNEIETAIDEEKKVSHSKLAEKVEDIVMLTPEKIYKTLKDADIDSCYTPIIQSRAPFNLKPSAQSNDKNLEFGTIIASMGVRYKRFCSNVCRTYFVNPTPEQQKHYEAALQLQQKLITSLKPGAKLGEVFEAVERKAKEEGVSKFFSVANLGFGIGIEFMERFLSIAPQSKKEVKANMAFNIDIGLSGMELEGGEEYAIKISDTVKITADGAVLMTKTPRTYRDIAYTLEDEEEIQERERQKREERKEKERKMKEMVNGKGKGAREELGGLSDERVYRTRGGGRKEDDEKKKSEQEKRKVHQKELWEKMRADNIAQLSSKTKQKSEQAKETKYENLISYPRPQDMPAEIQRNRISVDPSRDSILIPIYGDLIPFHISNVKNASSLQTEDFELKINFMAPSVGPGGAANQAPSVANNLDCVFLREVTFKMGNEKNLSFVLRQIQDLRKKWNQRQSMKKKTEDIVEQDKLIKSRSHDFPRLHNVLVRPTLGGRRTAGTLEVHKNGFLFTGGKGQTLELLFNNIKYAFYQPCQKGSLITVIHFHLLNAIMIGKKKATDIQFYVEVVEAVRDVEKDKKMMFDQDELDEEQREKQNKRKWNEKFRKFVTQTSNVVDGLSFDSPFDALSFYGTVFDRYSVKLCPSVDALLYLQEPPFFCLPLDDVEIAVFERVHYHLKHFDLTFVFKDRSKKACSIGSIPAESFDTLEEWLDSRDIKYYTSKTNFRWDKIIQHSCHDPHHFWVEEGGWEALLGESDDEDEEDESGDDSGFEMDTNEDYSESDEYSEESESDYSGSEGESESEGDDSEEDVDWDEMDKRAKEEDSKRFRGDELKRKRDSDDEDSGNYKPKKRRK